MRTDGVNPLRVAVLVCLMLVGLVGCGVSSDQEAKNVVFIVGDGMGGAHRDAVRLSSVGLEGSLEMDALSYSGSVHTGPADPEELITDSAAGGTALATGVKTYNGAVGVGPDGAPVTSILEEAARAGKATGLVTTSQVTDATPAAFAAHVPDRTQRREIARQYIEETEPDVILGGGENDWFPLGDEGAFEDDPEKVRDDASGDLGSENLIEGAQRAGYEYVSDAGGLSSARGPKLLGLFANEEMFVQRPEEQGDVYEPSVPLPEMTRKALDTLSVDPDGFFLLVEEEAIDEMSHQNNTPLMVEAGKRLDEAVGVARDFAEEEEPETLIVVTADHECGGLTIEEPGQTTDESGEAPSGEDEPLPVADSDLRFVTDWTTTSHTGGDVPLNADGPGAAELVGDYENTHVHAAVRRALLR